jgi:predicted transcriptional regulator
MPIGIVSDDDFQRELSRHKPNRVSSIPSQDTHEMTRASVEVMETPGRKQGDTNIPDALRKIIGEDAVINGRQSALQIAEEFGISPASVSAYARGATSTASYNTPSSSIISHINKSRARAIKRASKTLNGALEAITQDKLDYADARDLSTIAKDMSVIIKNLEPEQGPPVDPNAPKSPQFVIFAPTFKDERSYDVINVTE